MVLREALIKHHLAKSAGPPPPTYPLKEESRRCLKNLAAYHPTRHAQNPYQSHRYPLSRCAAVLVALFVGRMGDLYVILNRRADTLRSFAGDTSLPGGKREKGDRSPEDTARREGCEEIGLPQDRRKIPLLCTLEPFLSTNNLIVFPVVVLVTDPRIKPILNEPEVASIFSHPLLALLTGTPPIALSITHNDEAARPEYHTYRDIVWGDPDTRVRVHTFVTGREGTGLKPIIGLTAAMLIRTAVVGYGPDFPPAYEIDAPSQPLMDERLWYAMENIPSLIEACKKEHVKVHRRTRKVEDDGRRSRPSVRSKL